MGLHMNPLRCLAALALAATAACTAARGGTPDPGAMTPGIPLELARERAALISAIEYNLSFDLRGSDRTNGTAVVRFDRRADAGDLVMDFRGITLDGVSANARGVSDYLWKNGHILIPARHLVEGRNQLVFNFAAPIAPAGAGVLRFEDPSDGSTYLYTLLVPADAHQLFPSFDQPDLKAVFRLEILAPGDWSVVTNAPLADTARFSDILRWTFAPTEPISTYLFAFAAGPWTRWEAEGERPFTLYGRRSRAAQVDADELIRLHLEGLAWLEGYFEMEHPFAKLDAVLAPAFPFGGMEHPGAIFYSEDRFVFREPPTLDQRLSRLGTLNHELAHLWFGDLVTMRWFDDLWLKEGFSTYMAARMQDALLPGTGAWKTFYLRNKPLAYAVDATSGTTPVWQELSNLDLAKTNYGPIVYNKAPAILKQLEFLVGEAAFRDGMQRFLRTHAYGSADWRDLLAAISTASGSPLDAFGEHYILRPGLPVVETELRVANGHIRELRLRQRPARVLPDDPGGWWPGRIEVLLGYSQDEDVVLPVVFEGEETVVADAAGLPVPDFVFANHGDYGYGIFLLDPWSARYLRHAVGSLEDPLLRAMAWGALWDLVREARLDPAEYVEVLLRELPRETDEQIASALLHHLAVSLERYLPETRAEVVRERAERTLLERADDEAFSYGARKTALDTWVSVARTPRSRTLMAEYLDGRRELAGQPLGQPSRWALVRALLALGHPDAEEWLSAEGARDRSADVDRMRFLAGAARPSITTKDEYFRRYFSDERLNEDWVTASLEAFLHPEHASLTLPYLRPALGRLEWIRDNRRIFFLPRWIQAFVGSRADGEALEVVDRFLEERPDLAPDVRRKLLQARDELERTVMLRQKARAGSP
jgi:aminopeptidase N